MNTPAVTSSLLVTANFLAILCDYLHSIICEGQLPITSETWSKCYSHEVVTYDLNVGKHGLWVVIHIKLLLMI